MIPINNQSVTATLPGKLMLMGEHAAVYGFPCLAAAVDKKLTVKLNKRTDGNIIIRSDYFKKTLQSDWQKITGKIEPAGQYLTAALRTVSALISDKTGMDMEIKSDFSGRYGLGSSAAVTAGAIAGIAALFGLNLSKEELFKLTYRSILTVAEDASGYDAAAVVFGGVIYYKKGDSKPEKIDAYPNLLVCYSGSKADTVEMVRMVAGKMNSHRKAVLKIFEATADLVEQARQSLISQQYDIFGKLMNFSQDYLEDLGVVTSKLNELILKARKAGALGAKISGAGGGDCLIALVDDSNSPKVAQALIEAGGEMVDTAITSKEVSIS